MNATQARTLTIGSRKDLQKELDRIFELVADLASEGKNEMFISPLTESVIINHLVRDFGFITIKEKANKIETLKITW